MRKVFFISKRAAQERSAGNENAAVRKKGRRVGLILAAAVLTVSLTAGVQADVRRGDSNEEVYELQRLLYETGWLFTTPDGVFGANTENALNVYKNQAGLTPDGLADAEVFARLQADWNNKFGQTEQNAEEQPASAAEGEKPSDYETPPYCTTVLHYGMMGVEYCEEHLETLRQDYALQAEDTAESWHQAVVLWEGVIDSLYNEWVESASEAEKLTIVSQYGAWKSACEQQRTALSAVFPDDQKLIEQQMEAMIKAQAVMLCGMRASRPVQQ